MGKQKLTIQDLSNISFPSAVAKSLSLNIMNRHFKHTSKEEKINIITNVLTQPEAYLNHDTLAVLAHKLVSHVMTETFTSYELDDEPKHFDIFGSKHIDTNAIQQMALAMRL